MNHMDNLDRAKDIEKQANTIQEHKPYVGMEFDYEDDAKDFYKYARKTGFSTRVLHTSMQKY